MKRPGLSVSLPFPVCDSLFRRTFYRAATMVFVMAMLIHSGPSHARPQPETPARISYDIPSQPLNTALLSFARSSGVDLFYTPETTRTHRSGALRGIFTPQTALQKLLAGTGLRAHFTEPSAAIILHEDAPAPSGPVPGSAAAPEPAVLVLDKAEVRARPLARLSPATIAHYAHLIQTDILKRLNADPYSRTVPYQLNLSVRLGPDGCLSEVRLLNGRDETQDRYISDLLSPICIEAPPAAPVPRPFHFRIASSQTAQKLAERRP